MSDISHCSSVNFESFLLILEEEAQRLGCIGVLTSDSVDAISRGDSSAYVEFFQCIMRNYSQIMDAAADECEVTLGDPADDLFEFIFSLDVIYRNLGAPPLSAESFLMSSGKADIKLQYVLSLLELLRGNEDCCMPQVEKDDDADCNGPERLESSELVPDPCNILSHEEYALDVWNRARHLVAPSSSRSEKEREVRLERKASRDLNLEYLLFLAAETACPCVN